VQRLTNHAWPGNVRELRNAMERVAVMCRSEIVTASDLDFLATASSHDADINDDAGNLSSAVEQLERRMIAEALAESKGNRAEAARRLGIHRQLLHAKAEKYRLGKRNGAD
jgi:DNA-binding NtrC family response regulator